MGILTNLDQKSFQTSFTMSTVALEDLMLDEFMHSLFSSHTGGQPFDWIPYLTADADVIRYRRSVIQELSQFPEIIEALQGLCEGISYSRQRKERGAFSEYGPDAFREFGAFNELYHQMNRVVHVLAKYREEGKLQSESLLRLEDTLQKKIKRYFPQNYETKWEETTTGFDLMKSMKVVFHLDDELQISSVSLESINSYEYEKPGLFHKKANDYKNAWEMSALRDLTTPVHDLQEALLTSNQRYFTRILAQMTVDMDDLYLDLIFYLGALEYIHQMNQAKAELCYPDLRSGSDRGFTAKAMLNPVLLVKNPDKVKVANDVEFDADGEIFLLTGINQGGKTTFLRTVGLIQFFTQLGWPVTAQSASISLVDQIVTVFSHEEDTGLSQGKLGQELSTMKKGLEKTTPHSLLLCNEPITGTSPMENLYLSRIILTACKVNGYKGIWVTHLYDLADRAEVMNQELSGSKITSLVAGARTGNGQIEASYHIEKGAPAFTSYAREVLNKEVSLES